MHIVHELIAMIFTRAQGWSCHTLSSCMHNVEHTLQVIVVNYEDAHTTMEAPDEDDESSYM